MKRVLLTALGLLVVTGCVKKINSSGQRATTPGLISTWMTWVKDKGDKFDAEWNLMNESQQTIIIMSDDVHCSRGSAAGRIVSGAFSRGNVAVSLRPGQRKEFLIICEVGSTGGGDFRMSIGQIYDEDPANGLKRNVIAQNVNLVLGPGGNLVADGSSPAPTPYASKSSGGSSGSGIGSLDPFRMSSGSAVNNSGGSSSTSSPPPTASAPPPPPPAAPPPTVTAPVASGGMDRRSWPAAKAHPEWVMAIMDVDDVNKGVKTKAIDADLVRNIGDQLRIFVAERGVQTVDKSAQEAAFKESIARMKSESYGACYDDSCQIELGKALAATHILRSKITRFGSKCVLNGELIDLRSEVAVAAASSRGDCVAEGFLNMSEEVAVAITAQ